MDIIFSEEAWQDYQYWVNKDKKILKRINELIKDIIHNNSSNGIGKPEPLKYDWQGYWSRRINKEHRLIYKKTNDKLKIAACRYHY